MPRDLSAPGSPIVVARAAGWLYLVIIVCGLFGELYVRGSLVVADELGENQARALASFLLDLHAHGYDLGLLFFGVHCVLLGTLIVRSSFLPKALGVLTLAASAAYLIGSSARFLRPDLVSVVAPIYAVALIAELALCFWLLVRGVDRQAWDQVVVRGA